MTSRIRIQDGEAVETATVAWSVTRPMSPWPCAFGVGELTDGRVVLIVEVRGQPHVAVPCPRVISTSAIVAHHLPRLLEAARELLRERERT